MSGSVIQDLVAEKIKMLYSISQELETCFLEGTIRQMAT